MALDYLRRYISTPAPASTAAEPGTRRAPIESLLSGTLHGSENSACFISDTALSLDAVHGLHCFEPLQTISPENLAVLTKDPEIAYADLAGAVFLDTETTGLSTGAGTYVFLVGAGFVADGKFCVRQFFLRSPGEEGPFLGALDSFLRRFSLLVTFNGKAFDWPLLESRFVGHREFRRPPLDEPSHIDLLHPARRLWKRRLESCALSSLEQSVLGVSRTGQDVPGWMIPSIYFSYLRTGDGRDLQRVFYHNLYDILSLAALLVHLASVIADPMCGLLSHASDFLCVGKTLDRAGEEEAAIACYEQVLKVDATEVDRREALIRLALAHKRERRWDAALQTWDRLLDAGTTAALFALVERAKYYEHVEREYMDALEDVQHAFNLLELTGASSHSVDLADLEHRRGRLLNRVYRHRSWTSRGYTDSKGPKR